MSWTRRQLLARARSSRRSRSARRRKTRTAAEAGASSMAPRIPADAPPRGRQVKSDPAAEPFMTTRLCAGLLGAGLFVLLASGAGCSGSGGAEAVGPMAMRRLTADQYRQTIADVFAPDIKVIGRTEPDARRDGLLAVGTAWVSVTPAGLEQYASIARRIAEQVVAPENRERFVPCEPVDAAQPDAACTEKFIRKYGRRLLRRPLDGEDVRGLLAIAEVAAREKGDFRRLFL